VNKILPAVSLSLALLACVAAFAGEASAQDSMFLTPGKSPAMQALEAKKNARCVAMYGPGWGALGASDTCIRIGGRVGVEVGTSSKRNQLFIVPSPAIGVPAPTFAAPRVGVIRAPSTGAAARADVYVDTRTQTEVGEFSTHVGVGAVRASGAAVRGPDYVH
jgi:hypothetical protein